MFVFIGSSESQAIGHFTCVCHSTPTDNSGNPCSLVCERFDIDVAYIDPISGLVARPDVALRQRALDTASTARVKSQRHRSVVIDPEIRPLPSYSQNVINLGDKKATDDLISSFPGGVPVISLSLTGTCLSNRLTDRLVESLFQFPCFRVLSLVKCHRTEASLRRLQRSIADRKSDFHSDCQLTRLDVRLSRDAVGGGAAVDGCPPQTFSNLSCVAWRSLRSMCLTGCGLTSAGCSVLFRYFVTDSRLLHDLDIGFNDVADAEPIANALMANCSLQRLRLRGNAITSAGAVLIFNALRRNYRLDHLDIGSNQVGSSANDRLPVRTVPTSSSTTQETNGLVCDQGQTPQGQTPMGPVAQSIAEALVCNRTLRQLDVERCGLGLDECRGIGRGLLTNATLTDLDLSVNPSIGDIGLSLIVSSLRRNKRCAIETLSMNMCTVSDVGVLILLRSIAGSGRTGNESRSGRTKLKCIKLCYNNIEAADRSGSAQNKRHSVCRNRRISAEASRMTSPLSEGGSSVSNGGCAADRFLSGGKREPEVGHGTATDVRLIRIK